MTLEKVPEDIFIKETHIEVKTYRSEFSPAEVLFKNISSIRSGEQIIYAWNGSQMAQDRGAGMFGRRSRKSSGSMLRDW